MSKYTISKTRDDTQVTLVLSSYEFGFIVEHMTKLCLGLGAISESAHLAFLEIADMPSTNEYDSPLNRLKSIEHISDGLSSIVDLIYGLKMAESVVVDAPKIMGELNAKEPI